ncbi:MAG: hypothetical protein P1S60_18250 [Anaerolineae bacterium]|nr:hypothetical protein [Anaerolineae bacterium]
MTDTTGTTTYNYDAANRLISVNGVTYTWDARGNLINDSVFTYTYNAAGKMVLVEGITTTLAYTYTADGLRVVQAVNGVEDTFTWDWATSVPEMLSDGEKLYLVGHDTLGWDKDSTWNYIVPDALGSIRQETDAVGDVTATREWSPYGIEIEGTKLGLGYTGEWQAEGTELTYLRTRWYDGTKGRFTQVDQWEGNIWQPRTLWSYIYVSDNPINNRDPNGLVDCSIWPIALRWLCQNTEAGDLDSIELFYYGVAGYGLYEGGDFYLASIMMSHYLNGGGSEFKLLPSWSSKLMNDPKILLSREFLFNTFIENDVRSAVEKSRFNVASTIYRGLDFYDWDQRPLPESPGLIAAIGHVAINGEFSAKGIQVCYADGYVVSYSSRYFIDDSEQYEWFMGTETNFGNIFGTGYLMVPHKWAIALRDANPPRAHEYQVSASFQEKGRVLLKRYSWRTLEWWEIPAWGILSEE